MEEKNMIKFELGLPRGIYFSNIHNSLFTKNKNMCVFIQNSTNCRHGYKNERMEEAMMIRVFQDL
jgi:hypothetical protein